MAVVKVACPRCGEVANATVNSKSDEIRKLGTGSGGREYKSSCKNCGGTFYYNID